MSASSRAARAGVPDPARRQQAERHFSDAVRCHLAGDVDGAAAGYRAVLAIDATMAEAHNNLGVLLRGGDPDAALAAFRAAVGLRPAYADAQNNLGLLLQARGAVAEAMVAFRAAVAANPRSADATNNLGLALLAANDVTAAVAMLETAVRLDGDRPDVHNNLGNALLRLGRMDDAERAYRHALTLDADYPDALNNLGAVMRARRDFTQAIPLLRRALALRPGYLEALHNLATSLPDIGGSAEVEQMLRDAVAADPENAALRATLAIGLVEIGRYAEARALAEQVVAADPRNLDGWNTLGLCAFEARDFAEMLRCLDRTLAVDPANVVARWNRALGLFAIGDYARAWPEYEVRWELVNMMRERRHFAQPEWDGGSLDGRTLLLYTEQGFGDAIQFARFARTLRARWNVRLVVECVGELVPLFRACDWVDAVVPRGTPLPAFDVHCALLSVPLKLGVTLADVDAAPYLAAPARPVGARLAAERAAEPHVLRVGLVWSGRAPNPNLARRSLPLAALAPLTEIPGVALYSLQVGDGTAQLAASPLGERVTDLAPELRDFVDTAAAMRELDLVITLDSAVAHLAGGLGVPTWVLLMRAADWRWLTDRDDSPWYGSARLFRQTTQDDWTPVVAAVAAALRAHAADRPTDRAPVAPTAPEGAPLASRQRTADGAARFTLTLPFARLADAVGFDRYAAELAGEGVDPEVRHFLDEQLRAGDAVIDVGAAWGFVALAAATAAAGGVRVTALVDDAADARVIRDAEARVTGALDVRVLDDLSRARIADLAGDAPRVFVRVADAAHAAAVLASAADLVEQGRLAAVAWTPRIDGTAATGDAMLLAGLEAFGFQHLVLRIDAEGPYLDARPADSTDVVFSLSPAFLAGHAAAAPAPRAIAIPASRHAAGAPAPARRLGLDWQIGATSGWGVYGQHLVRRCLERGDVGPVLLSAPSLAGMTPPVVDALAPVLEDLVDLAGLAAEHAGDAIVADFPVLRALGNGLCPQEPGVPVTSARDVGLVFFESTALDATALAHGRRFARIVAGSTWNADVLRAHGLANVRTVLQGVDATIFHPGPRGARFGDRFVVFSGGKLEYRKGQDIVVAAFREFHRRHPDALLVTAWHNHWPQSMGEIGTAGHVVGVPAVDAHGRADIAGWLARNGVPAGAAIDVGVQPNAAMGALLRDVDVALFTNRAEGGTNLVAMECLATGVPTILSANTGHLDLVDDARCWALRQQGAAAPTLAFPGTDGWGETTVDEALAALEAAYADRAGAARRGAAAAEWMRDLSWPRQIDRLLDALADLH